MELRISDESMGGIIGDLILNENYQRYKNRIQSKTEEKGIANVSDFNFRFLIDDYELSPEGGIGITDFIEFDEIIIESADNQQDQKDDYSGKKKHIP
ncbi:MAG: hypothetical protein RIR11_1633 [Bacteroidota bacterium]